MVSNPGGLADNVHLPDESTTLRFRPRPKKSNLARCIVAEVNAIRVDAGYQGVEKRPRVDADVAWHVAIRPGKKDTLRTIGVPRVKGGQGRNTQGRRSRQRWSIRFA